MDLAELQALAEKVEVKKGTDTQVVLEFNEDVSDRLTAFFDDMDDQSRIFRLVSLLSLAVTLRGPGDKPDLTILW